MITKAKKSKYHNNIGRLQKRYKGRYPQLRNFFIEKLAVAAKRH